MLSRLEAVIGALDEVVLIAAATGVVLWVLVASSILAFELGLLASGASAVVLIVLGYLLLKPQLRAPQVGAETFIGRRVTAATRIAPSGLVTIDGTYWSAESVENIDVGEQVEVFAIKGTALFVRKPNQILGKDLRT